MPHAHHAAGQARKGHVHVVTVSTSRSAGEDRSGPLIRELLVREGHVVQGASLVPDDRAQLGERLDGLLGEDGVDGVIFTGGTGISARDCTVEVVRARLDRELPGFGELFRMLSFQQVGSAAMLSSAVAGVARSRLIFAIPGSPKACQLAMETLILPQLGHLLYELDKESPAPIAPALVAAALPPPPAAPATPAAPAGDRTRTLVESLLDAIEATVVRGAPVEIPDALTQIAGAMDVLRSAGEQAAVRFGDGGTGAIFAYPSLTRRDPKLIVIRNGLPFPEVIAVHRGLKGTGICRGGVARSILPSSDERLAKITKERTGHAYEGSGRLFAVEGRELVHFVTPEGDVSTWDGRTVTPVGSVARAVTSLLTDWSQR